MNLSDLIDLSETDELAKTILDAATRKAFGDRKPLTEILEMKTSIDKVVSQIVELSLEEHTGDSTRDMYSVLLKVGLRIGEIMRLTLEQERKDGT